LGYDCKVMKMPHMYAVHRACLQLSWLQVARSCFRWRHMSS